MSKFRGITLLWPSISFENSGSCTSSGHSQTLLPRANWRQHVMTSCSSWISSSSSYLPHRVSPRNLQQQPMCAGRRCLCVQPGVEQGVHGVDQDQVSARGPRTCGQGDPVDEDGLDSVEGCQIGFRPSEPEANRLIIGQESTGQ